MKMNKTFYISKVHICNFKSIVGKQDEESSFVTIDFCNPEEKLYKSMILAGPNGYGKTSIFQAIAFALTGQLELSVYADKNRSFVEHIIINDLRKEAFVAVEFVDEKKNIKTVLRYTKKGKADSGKDLLEEAKDFDAYIISGKFDLEKFKTGDFPKVTAKEIAEEFGEKNMKEWLQKNYIQQEYGSNILFRKDGDRVNFLNNFINVECDSYFSALEDEKKNVKEKIDKKKEEIRKLCKDTKIEQKSIIGEMPQCGKVFEDQGIIWDKEEYNSKEPFEQYRIKAEGMQKFLHHIDVYRMKRCCDIAEMLKKDSKLVKKLILSNFESSFLEEYKMGFEKKKYITELIQNEDNLLTKDLEERYISEQQREEILALREKRKNYVDKSNEREQIYLQIDRARGNLEGKEKLVQEIFKNVCPMCGHDYNKDDGKQNLSEAMKQYQQSFNAMQNILNSTLEDVHKEVKSEMFRIQKALQDILAQQDFNLKTYEVILDYENNLGRYHECYEQYIEMCECKTKMGEVSVLKELLEDKEFYKDIININKMEEKSKAIDEILGDLIENVKKSLEESEYFDQVLYSENRGYLMELKDKNITEVCAKLDIKITQLQWLYVEQKSKEMSDNLNKLEKSKEEIKEYYIRLKKLDKLVTCKIDSQKEYKNNISKLIEIPLYIYSGKLIQTHQNGLGVYCYTGADEEQLTQFKLCNTGKDTKGRQDITTRFSAGQKAVVNIALMLAFRKISNSSIDVFLIDDPCQSMDDLNIASLVEILKNEFPTTQVLVSSHEDEIAGYMYYKYLKIGRNAKLYNVQKELYTWNAN